jgi:hypothetical protein
MANICPCCGYSGLREPPRTASGGGSYEICPSCGFQFGVSDEDDGYTYARWRAQWKKRGMPWSSKAIAPPSGWSGKSQLAHLPAKRRKAPTKGPSSLRRRRNQES